MSQQTIREVVAVFDSAEALEQAVFDLEINGFDRASFSILASEHKVEETLGHRYRRIEEMEDEPKAPRETFFARASRLEAEFGLAPAFALLAAVGVGLGSGPITLPILVAGGSGAVLGAFLGQLIHRHHATQLQEQLDRGGLLLWVNVRDRAQESKAMTILEAHGAQHVHAHELAV